LEICVSRFDQFGFSRKSDLILECLKFKTVHFRRQHVADLFLFNAIKGKIDFHSVIDTANLRVLTKLIRDIFIFTVGSNVRPRPSAECVSAPNGVCRVS
jgi:hypothetical protein